MKIKWKTIAPLIVWLVIYLLPIPAGLNANQWHYFAVFAAVITGLVLESMPVGAVGLIGLTFAAVMGYVESDPNKSLRWALSGFAEGTVWLIVGAFIFSIGYRKSGLGKRIALLLARALSHRARTQRRGTFHRQEGRERGLELVAVVHRLCPAGRAADPAGAVGELRHLPARGQGEPRNRVLGGDRARGDGPAVTQ